MCLFAGKAAFAHRVRCVKEACDWCVCVCVCRDCVTASAKHNSHVCFEDIAGSCIPQGGADRGSRMAVFCLWAHACSHMFQTDVLLLYSTSGQDKVPCSFCCWGSVSCLIPGRLLSRQRRTDKFPGHIPIFALFAAGCPGIAIVFIIQTRPLPLPCSLHPNLVRLVAYAMAWQWSCPDKP